MTLSKAIRRLKGYIKYRKPESDDHFYESVQLGIEALKRIQRRRIESGGKLGPLLPGETEE